MGQKESTAVCPDRHKAGVSQAQLSQKAYDQAEGNCHHHIDTYGNDKRSHLTAEHSSADKSLYDTIDSNCYHHIYYCSSIYLHLPHLHFLNLQLAQQTGGFYEKHDDQNTEYNGICHL